LSNSVAASSHLICLLPHFDNDGDDEERELCFDEYDRNSSFLLLPLLVLEVSADKFPFLWFKSRR